MNQAESYTADGEKDNNPLPPTSNEKEKAPGELLRELKALHDDGVLTDQEYFKFL